MKSFICTVTLLLAITMLIAILPTESEAAIYNDTVRLHILANSDEDIDQNTKLCVRDYLLKNYSESLNAEGGADTARKKAEALLPEIERDINGYLHSLGIDYGCTLTLGEEWYDTREYENFTMPKGIYTSLIVKLGNASGKNWWCVMYPPMCLDIATENAKSDDAIIDYTKEEAALITGTGYNIKFKLLELVCDAARQLSKNG